MRRKDVERVVSIVNTAWILMGAFSARHYSRKIFMNRSKRIWGNPTRDATLSHFVLLFHPVFVISIGFGQLDKGKPYGRTETKAPDWSRLPVYFKIFLLISSKSCNYEFNLSADIISDILGQLSGHPISNAVYGYKFSIINVSQILSYSNKNYFYMHFFNWTCSLFWNKFAKRHSKLGIIWDT